MDDNLNFETYLYISPEKFVILVNSEQNEKMYKNQIFLKNEYQKLNLESLNSFLNDNIFKIEKKLKKFVKKIFVILDSSEFFPVKISIKRYDYERRINLKDVSYVLTEARDCCKKTISDRKIVHLIIDNYRIDGEDYSFLPKDKFSNNFSLDISFFCISEYFIKNIEVILIRYQISINHLVSEKYVRNFLENDRGDLFLMAKKIAKGHNPNEAMFINKTLKNRGFFEKFFNFFN